MAGIILRIENMYAHLAPSQKLVASYILSHKNNVVGLTINELAKRSSTSNASIINFCKKIGLKGFREFSILLSAELAKSDNDNLDDKYTDINEGDSIDSVIRNVCINNIKAIEDSFLLSDKVKVEDAVNFLSSANRICLFGIGASGFVALDAQHKFMRINMNCVYYQDTHAQLTLAANLSNTDIAIILSWSGETKEMVEAARIAHANGTRVIAITKYGKHALHTYSDIVFYLSAPETTIRSGALSSRIAQMNIMDILYICFVTKNYKIVKKYLQRTREEVFYNLRI